MLDVCFQLARRPDFITLLRIILRKILEVGSRVRGAASDFKIKSIYILFICEYLNKVR